MVLETNAKQMTKKISLTEYKEKLPEPLRRRTLCFLVKDEKVLLGRKRKGFGQGNWLGIGGKVEQGETLEEAVIREMLEEVGVKPSGTFRVATLDFYFPYVEEPRKWNQQVCVFIAREWEGEPKESEEIFPQWFDVNKIPVESMWSDAIHWLPKILKGVKLKAEFTFNRHLGVEEVNVVEEKLD